MDKAKLTVDAIVAKTREYDAEKISQRDSFNTIVIEKLKLSKVSQISVPQQPISKVIETLYNYG